MRYLLSLRDLDVKFSIGIHDHERAAKQRLLICVTIVTSAADDLSDDIADVFDYDKVRNEIIALADEGHFELQETVCLRIKAMCEAHPSVSGGFVRTRKPDIFTDAKSIGCQMSWGDDAAMVMLAAAPK